MKQRTQVYCAYTGYVFMALFFVAFWPLAHFIPPPDPSWEPDHVARFFKDHTTGIRLGMLLALGASALLLLWVGAIASQLRRIEGRMSALVYAQVAAGACLVIEFLFPLMFWANAAFRPEGDPEIIQRLNDLAWLPFLGIVSTAIIQCVAIAVLTLQDRRADPIFPRWFAYFNMWCGTLFLPGPLVIFFKDGPLSWNGVICWWLLLSVFSIWTLGVTVMTARAIKRDDGDLADAGMGPEDPSELAALRDEVAALRGEVAALRERTAAS